jgi:alginate O-acetyltransferase complex protein AlgI
MKFQSVTYLCFLVLIWLTVMCIRSPKSRQTILLLASYFFYATWQPAFLAVLIGSSLFNYAWGEVLRRKARADLLWIGLGANIVLLVCFKYIGWLLELVGIRGFSTGLLVPVGLSFYSFMAMSYLLDTYRDAEEHQPALREFLLYLAFWPTVLAGPICRVGEMIPQFRRAGNSTLDDISCGAKRILLGLFMKVVVADMLGYGILSSEGVDTGFDSVSGGWSGVDVWFLAIGFGFQLFFDFAGYSHMAIGSARLFGIRVRENFDSPYLSRSPAEFWTRWHMSLSFWIRDYLFFPLATRSRKFWWRHVALICSMVIFGLWHGARSTFLLWGLYHGCLLVGHRVLERLYPNGRGEGMAASTLGRGCTGLISWGITFGLISIGWVLFRCKDLEQAAHMLSALITPSGYFRLTLRLNFYILVLAVVTGYFLCAGVGHLLKRLEQTALGSGVSWLVSPVLYSTLMIAVIVWSRQAATFVYMQF